MHQAHFQLGRALCTKGEFSEAIARLRKARDLVRPIPKTFRKSAELDDLRQAIFRACPKPCWWLLPASPSSRIPPNRSTSPGSAIRRISMWLRPDSGPRRSEENRSWPMICRSSTDTVLPPPPRWPVADRVRTTRRLTRQSRPAGGCRHSIGSRPTWRRGRRSCESEPPQARQSASRTLHHWKGDSDLARIARQARGGQAFR